VQSVRPLHGCKLATGACWPRSAARHAARPQLRRKGVHALPEAVAWIGDAVHNMPDQVQSMGAYGPMYFFCVYVLSQFVLIPVTLPTVTAGFVFGFPMGFAIIAGASMTSAAVGFCLARTLLRPQIERLTANNTTFQRINRAAAREGFKIVLLSRLSLVINFSFLNYLFGLSAVKFEDFMAATFLGFIPEAMALAYASSTARSIISEGTEVPWYGYMLGFAALATLVHQVAEIAKQAMDEAVEEDGAVTVVPEKAATAGAA